MKHKFTVVGLYTDNSQVYVSWTRQSTAAAAATWGRKTMLRHGGGGTVLSVFDGWLVDLYGKDDLYHE